MTPPDNASNRTIAGFAAIFGLTIGVAPASLMAQQPTAGAPSSAIPSTGGATGGTADTVEPAPGGVQNQAAAPGGSIATQFKRSMTTPIRKTTQGTSPGGVPGKVGA